MMRILCIPADLDHVGRKVLLEIQWMNNMCVSVCRVNERVCKGQDEAERKRETAPLRLQLASSSKAVARALGDDAPLAGALQQVLEDLMAFLNS